VSGGQQRVGAFAEVPHLLRDFGIDPAEVMAGVGLEPGVLHDPENAIPFTAAGKLLQASAMRTGCPHFGLLVGQRNDTRSLGLVGGLMRNAPTWGRAVQDLVDNQPRYVRGGVPYVVVRDGVAWTGYAIHLQGTEGIDQFCDGAIAVGFNMMRELCGALPDEVLLSRKSPADVRPYRRFFRVPVRFDAEQSALVFSASKLECPVPGADPRQRAILEASVARYWSVALPNVTDQVVRILRPRVPVRRLHFGRGRTLPDNASPDAESPPEGGGHNGPQAAERNALRGRAPVAAWHPHRHHRYRHGFGLRGHQRIQPRVSSNGGGIAT